MAKYDTLLSKFGHMAKFGPKVAKNLAKSGQKIFFGHLFTEFFFFLIKIMFVSKKNVFDPGNGQKWHRNGPKMTKNPSKVAKIGEKWPNLPLKWPKSAKIASEGSKTS